ncbi:MAG: flagellar basal body P-ring formation chaperone FlgA [Nitrospiria bacterium]
MKKITIIIPAIILVFTSWSPKFAFSAGEIADEIEIKEAVQNYIGGRLAVSSSEIEVRLLGEIGDFKRNVTPRSHFTIREANGTALLGNAMFLLVSDDSADKYPPVWISVRSEWVHMSVVAARSLKKNQIIGPDDLSLQLIHSDQTGDFFSKINDLVGKRVVQQERAGTVINREMVQNPPLFYQGERVTLLVETGHLIIMASGKAMEDGFEGKMVSVLNLDSHRTVYGEPVDGTTVKVNLGRE